MPQVILRPYYLAFRNRFKARDRSKHAGKRDLLLLVVTLIIMSCIFFGTVMILRSLAFNQVLEVVIPVKILGLLFYAFFVLLLISNTVACIGNIYNAQNMNLLLYTPVSSLRLYLAKLIETLFETSMMFVVFLFPVGLAYVFTLDVRPGFLICSAAIALPFLLIPTGIAMVIGTIFVRFASIVWRRGLFFLGCIAAMGGWALYSLISILGEIEFRSGGANAIIQMIGLFDNPNPIWLPSRWASDLISFFILGQVDSGETKLLLLLSSAVGSVALGYLVFDTFALSVRSAANVNEHVEEEEREVGKNAGTDSVRSLLEYVYSRLPLEQQTRAIILKDMTSLMRDRAQALQLLMYLGFAIVYLTIINFMSAALGLAPVAMQAWWAFLASINILFAGFILTAVMTRLVYPSISLEGKAFWILVTGPIDLRQLIRAKVTCWLPLSVLVSVTLLLAGIFMINPSLVLVICATYIGICMSIGCTSLAVGIGSMFASFEWESPNQISAGFGTLLLLLGSLSLVLLTLAPASLMTFLIMIPNLRLKFGPGIWQGAIFLCAVLTLVMNVHIGSWVANKGADSLKAQRKY